MENPSHPGPAAERPSFLRSLPRRLWYLVGPVAAYVLIPVLLLCFLATAPWRGFGEPWGWVFPPAILAVVAALVLAGRRPGWYRPGRMAFLPGFLVFVFLLNCVTWCPRWAIVDSASDRALGKGRWIVAGILEASGEREAKGEPPVWPSVGKYASSNEYFSKLLRNGRLTGFATATFACGGVEAAADAKELLLAGNSWNALAGAASAHPATPVLWTRNLAGLRSEDFAGADPARPRPWRDRLAPDGMSFGDRCVVLVRKDGRAETIFAKDLTDAAVLGGAKNDPATLDVLEALRETDPPSGEADRTPN